LPAGHGRHRNGHVFLLAGKPDGPAGTRSACLANAAPSVPGDFACAWFWGRMLSPGRPGWGISPLPPFGSLSIAALAVVIGAYVGALAADE
jgi:hypothetical protein